MIRFSTPLTSTVLLYPSGTQHTLGGGYLRLGRNIRQRALALRYAERNAQRTTAAVKRFSTCRNKCIIPAGLYLRTGLAVSQAMIDMSIFFILQYYLHRSLKTESLYYPHSPSTRRMLSY